MRLIDADALIDRILTNICKPCKEERKEDYNGVRCRYCQYGDEIDDVEDAPTIEPQKWIPVKFRPMDSEEREYWEEQFGEELAEKDAVMFDCPMPEDGQEILVSYRNWISMDKCEIDGGGYGLEENGDWEDVIAWMPLPEPFKEGE